MPTSQVHRSIEVEAPPAEVWELLVDDEERSSWFGGESTLEPEPGSAAVFTEPDGTRRSAVVEEVDHDRRLSWTWWPEDGSGDGHSSASHVAVELTPTPAGTRISVVETPLAPTAQASTMTAATGPLLDLELRVLSRSRRPVAPHVG